MNRKRATNPATVSALIGMLWFVSWASAAPPADLVGYWPFDEGSGTLAADASGNGNNATLMGNAAWTTGMLDGAVQVSGTSGSYVAAPHIPLNSRSFTIAMWINPVLYTGAQCVLTQNETNAQNKRMHLRLGGPGGTTPAPGAVRMAFFSNDLDSPAGLLQDNNWYHLTFWYDFDNSKRRIYVNGEQVAEDTPANGPYLGASGVTNIGQQVNNQWFRGLIDDVQIYHRALTDAEINSIMNGLGEPGIAVTPNPAAGATDVLRDTTLQWTAGEFAVSHDVYFGETLEDVNSATPASDAFKGNQTETMYALDRLAFGKTYYWRIDEVNDPTAPAVFTGDVWSFEVEPEGILVSGLTATASSQNSPEEDPNNTINGVGLNPDGSHDPNKYTMWLSDKSDPSPWIRYDLSEPRKLFEMLVWNQNQQSEEDLGFGIMEAQISVSRDGNDFTDLGIVTLAQSAETAVDLQGMFAQSVKISVVSNYGGNKSGLSAVRLYAIPNGARELSPADGVTNVDPTTAVLTWRAGREAGAHNLYLGTDEQAVIDGTAPMVSLPATSTTPDLDLGMTYYWRVDEVNNVEDPAVWVGSVQNFTTAGSILVDDMESYKNEAGFYIYEAWADGYQKNDNGSLVGVGADFEAEKTIVHDGSQSLPMVYGDLGIADSWATRAIETPKDWSMYGIESLSLYFQGSTTNTAGQLYVKINNTKFEYKGAATDIQTNAWFPFTIDLAGVTTVDTLTIGVAGGSGMIYVDSIRLYPQASELITPVAPDAADLLASYAFEGNFNDSSGMGRHGTAVADAMIVADMVRGQVLSLDGTDDCVDLGPSGDPNQGFNPPGSFSLSAWVNITAFTVNWSHIIIGNRGEENVGWQLRRHSSTPNLTFTLRGTTGADDTRGTTDVVAMAGEWIQVTAVYDVEAGSRSVYINGLLDLRIDDSGVCAATTHNVYIGARANAANSGQERFFSGMIDDVRVYNRALSQAEALGSAGRTAPIYKSLD